MNINLNVTLSCIFNGKQSEMERSAMLDALDESISHIIAKHGKNAPQVNVGALNRAPRATQSEMSLRSAIDKERLADGKLPIDWRNLAERAAVLLEHGLDINARIVPTGKGFGETADDLDINPDEVPE